jgi:hypothetical protein
MSLNLIDGGAGKSVPMTVLTPMSPWRQWVSRILLWYFTKLPFTPVKRLQMIHFARWQVIPASSLYRHVENRKAKRSNEGFLLFATNFNGPWDPYIDAFALVRKIRQGMNFLWGTSKGFPCAWPLTPFKNYIHYYDYPVHCYYNAYPGISVRDIERSMRLQAVYLKFAEESGASSKAEFALQYRTFVDEVANELQIDADPDTSSYANAITGLADFGDTVPEESVQRVTGAERFLTVISPIACEWPGDERRVNELRALIWGMQTKKPNPFADAPMVHMLRLQVIETFRPALGNESKGRHEHAYLLLVAELDGRAADFIDWLYAHRPHLCGQIWGNCAGGQFVREGAVFFRRYMEQCRVPTQLGYEGYAYTVSEIRTAVGLRAQVSEQIRLLQGATDAQRLAAWRDFYKTGTAMPGDSHDVEAEGKGGPN